MNTNYNFSVIDHRTYDNKLKITTVTIITRPINQCLDRVSLRLRFNIASYGISCIEYEPNKLYAFDKIKHLDILKNPIFNISALKSLQ